MLPCPAIYVLQIKENIVSSYNMVPSNENNKVYTDIQGYKVFFIASLLKFSLWVPTIKP